MKKKKYNADLICPFCGGTHNYDFYSDSETVTCRECRIVFSLDDVLLIG